MVGPQLLDLETGRIKCIQADAAVRTPPSAFGNEDMVALAAVIGRLCVELLAWLCWAVATADEAEAKAQQRGCRP